MISALDAPTGSYLAREQRREIRDALDFLYVELAAHEEHHTIGRKHSTLMRWRAYRVHRLVECGAYLRSAVLAVLADDPPHKQVEALTKAYRVLKAAGMFREFVSVSADVLERDAARLPITRRHKLR